MTSSTSSGAGWAPPPTSPNGQERTWAMLAHLASFAAAWLALGLIAPLTVLLIKGNESAFVREHAVESLNFQLNALVWAVIGILLLVIAIGLILLPLVGIWYLIFVLVAANRASQGKPYRYPLILRVIH